MRPYRLFPAMLALLAAPALAAGAEPASPCGNSMVIQRNDTLSGIASRCDVSEASLLDANPAIQGSGDLQTGATLHIDGNGSGEGVGATVRRFSRRAGDTLGTLANDVGSSVQELLDRNPDLKFRLDKVGSKVGLTDGQPSAAVTVLPRSSPPGTAVMLTANGLRPNSPVSIGVGAPGAAYSVIGHAQTKADGTVETEAAVLSDAQTGQDVVFSVATGAGVSARTGRFTVRN